MANTIELAKKCLPLLDEVYAVSAKTAVLDAAASKLNFVNANTVNLFETEMDGLADYNRGTGFVDGDVVGTWKPYTLTQDRGRSFMVDAMDDEETLRMAFGTLANEFIRAKVSPEVDAYTFAKIAGTTGIESKAADLSASVDIAKEVDIANSALSDAEVPDDGRILFISEGAYANFVDGIGRTVMNGDGAVNNGIITYNGARVIRVPGSRFNTAITQVAGDNGGYTPAGYKINFLLIHPSAVAKIVKHVAPRIFEPSVNQKADAWKFDYRIYHDTFVMDKKKGGIYLHRGNTAN